MNVVESSGGRKCRIPLNCLLQARNIPVVLRGALPPSEPWSAAAFWSDAELKALSGHRIIQTRCKPQVIHVQFRARRVTNILITVSLRACRLSVISRCSLRATINQGCISVHPLLTVQHTRRIWGTQQDVELNPYKKPSRILVSSLLTFDGSHESSITPTVSTRLQLSEWSLDLKGIIQPNFTASSLGSASIGPTHFCGFHFCELSIDMARHDGAILIDY